MDFNQASVFLFIKSILLLDLTAFYTLNAQVKIGEEEDLAMGFIAGSILWKITQKKVMFYVEWFF